MEQVVQPSKRPRCETQTEVSEIQEQPKIMETLRVKRLSSHAILPVRASERAAGYDLSSAYDCEIPARGKALIKTDLTVAIPDGCYGRVAPRSSLAWKNHIDVGAGVIDADYRGPLGVVLFNHSEEVFQIKRGDRVAQLVLERIATPPVEEVDEIDDTVRGSGGFGSTGRNVISSAKPTGSTD